MKEVDLGYTKLEIHDRYCIIRTIEGIDATIAEHEGMREVVEQEISGPYGLVIDWINSYSVDPKVIEAIRDNVRIACCAVVTYRSSTAISLTGAVDIIKKPATFVRSLDEAQQWVLETLGDLRDD